MAVQIDLECGSTTANADRRKSVAFSPVFFLAGTKLMIPADRSVSSYHDLAGRTVAVSTGTTNADVVKRLSGTVTPPINVVETTGTDAAYDLVSSGAQWWRADNETSLQLFLTTIVAMASGRWSGMTWPPRLLPWDGRAGFSLESILWLA